MDTPIYTVESPGCRESAAADLTRPDPPRRKAVAALEGGTLEEEVSEELRREDGGGERPAPQGVTG